MWNKKIHLIATKFSCWVKNKPWIRLWRRTLPSVVRQFCRINSARIEKRNCVLYGLSSEYISFSDFLSFAIGKTSWCKSRICIENCTYSKTSTNDKTVFINQIFPQESLSLWSESIDLVLGIYFLYLNRTNLIMNPPD